MSSSVTDSLNLIFDADDTLWDSNIHFLEAFDSFAAAVENADLGLSRVKIQDAVRRTEIRLIKSLGYGRRPYVQALHEAAQELAPSNGELRDEIERIGVCLIERECALLPDVEPTLREQKLARSGLAPLFDRVETPREKDVDAYLRLVREAELNPSSTYMIGNSPRSDINPAVRAGLHAVYIPHPHTWELEDEEIAEADGMIIELPSFRRLVEVF